MDINEREYKYNAAIKQMQGFIHRIAAAHEHDHDLRKDLIQDIALAIWQALPNFRGDANIKTFIGRVAVNRCMSHAAKHARNSAKANLSQDLPMEEPNPEVSVQAKLTAQNIRYAVTRLPLSLREPTVLMLDGYKTGEIAEIIGVSAGAISVRLNRAKSKLAELLENPYAN